MTDLVIVAARRTPQGRLLGSLAGMSAADLGVAAANAALTGIDPAAIDQVIVGNVLGAGLGMNVARQIALRASLPERTPACSVNLMCGSGMQAVILAAQAIRAGEAEAVLCGGTESMSNAPHLLQRAPESRRLGADGRADSLQLDGLTDPLAGEHMGLTAERLAARYRISRDEQDVHAAASHAAWSAAHEAGVFAAELAPLPALARDEHPRPGIAAAKLATLKPAFSAAGTVTAGNASGINDGAAAVLMMSASKAKALGLQPLARIAAYASAGLEPTIMGMGPVPASKLCLHKAGWTADQLDLMEINEAFAAQACAVNKEMGWDTSKINVNGGAIAIGHPIGASGCRVLVTLIHEMIRRDARRGLASLCIGGGMGVALAIER